MKLSNRSIKSILLILIIGLSLTISSCDNPASSEEEHYEQAVGAVLTMNGQEIAHVENGTIQGQITVPAGEETALITITFIAEDGDFFQPDDPEYSLRWEEINTAIAEVEQHTEDGKWRFHIIGNSSGSTSVAFQLFHGTHSDFDLLAIPIIVN